MRTVADAIGTVQALLGDPRGGWVKRNYVLPLMNLCYGDLMLFLKNGGTLKLGAVVPVLNVPAGTSTLYPYQGANLRLGQDANAQNPKPVLKGLTDPLQVFVKPKDSAPYNYVGISKRSTLPHVNPNLNTTNAFGNSMYWSWMGNELRITPVNIALDIEVTGRFNPIPLVDDEQFLMGGEDIWVPLTFDTAAICGVERSNPALLEGYGQRATAAKDNLLADWIRQGQDAPARFQKISRDSGNGYIAWFWGI